MVLPHILEDLERDSKLTEIEKEAVAELREWDHFTDPDSVGATLFYSVYRRAIVRALENKVSDSVMHVFLKQRYSTNVVDLWFEDEDHIVWDDVSTEEKEDRGVGRAPRRSGMWWRSSATSWAATSDGWRWGIYHFLHPRHLFGGKSILGFMNLEKLELPGGLDSAMEGALQPRRLRRHLQGGRGPGVSLRRRPVEPRGRRVRASTPGRAAGPFLRTTETCTRGGYEASWSPCATTGRRSAGRAAPT